MMLDWKDNWDAAIEEIWALMKEGEALIKLGEATRGDGVLCCWEAATLASEMFIPFTLSPGQTRQAQLVGGFLNSLNLYHGTEFSMDPDDIANH